MLQKEENFKPSVISETLDLGFVPIDIRQQGVPAILTKSSFLLKFELALPSPTL